MMNAEYKTHVFRYRYAGSEWILRINATDAEDARQRIGRLTWATYDGIEMSDRPILFAPFEIAIVRVRNAALRLIARIF
jgi:hypothetical protein